MNKETLYNLTRRTGFIFKSALILAGILVVLGIGVSFLNTDRLDTFQRIVAAPHYVDEYQGELEELRSSPVHTTISRALREELESSRPFTEKLERIRFLLSFAAESQPVELPDAADLPRLSDDEYAVTAAFVRACREPGRNGTLDALRGLAAAKVQYANYALALIYQYVPDYESASKALNREIEFHDSNPSRKRLVGIYLHTKQFDALEQLKGVPGFESFITNYVLREIALSKMDWPALIKTHFLSAYEDVSVAMVVLALLSGMIWTTILFRFNGSNSILALALPALLLGVASTHATILLIYVQEYQFSFKMGSDVVGQIIYCVLGIGLREETMKLLFFVPLIPFLRKRGDLEILTVAALVGLGFAIEENINYFESTAGLSALGRFVTANFLHISLTAMCGLTLTRAVVHKGEDIQQAAVTFGMAVVAHGLYDAFIMVSVLDDYSFLSYTVFILIGFQYFGWLRHLRDEWKDPLSITAIFTYGVILVTGLSYGLYAWTAGPIPAFQTVGQEFLGIGIILTLFYREIPETIA